jgi:hypothetical protein
MNELDQIMLRLLSQRVTASTLEAEAAVKGAYALGVAREITDHARQDPLPEQPTIN